MGATVAAGAAVALLALWNPAASAGDGRETGVREPALMSVGGDGGAQHGSVAPGLPAADDPVAGQGSPPPVPALQEPVSPSGPPASAAGSKDPDTSVSSPALPYDPGYWTPERMASAKPMPMPSPG